MPLDAQTLLSEVQCYACYGFSQEQLLKLAMERRWLLSLSPSSDTSAEALLTYGRCYACFGGSQFDIMELALLDQISQLS